MKSASLFIILAYTLFTITGPVSAVQDMSTVEIKAEKLRDNLYVLFGAGGNIGLQFGEDGAYLIDDQYAPLSDKILAKVKELSGQTPRYVINTHYHGDHTGGNENMGKAGAIMIAHDNVRLRLTKDAFIKAFNFKMFATKKPGLPQITFSQSLSLHLNGEETRLIHVTNAHTDGDSLVHFTASNVIHMGDTMFLGRYPFIDVDAGGSIDGVIKAVKTAIDLSDTGTKIIPGHGPVTDLAGLKAYHTLLTETRAIVFALKQEGKSLADIQALMPLKKFDQTVPGGGANWHKQYLAFLYRSL